MDEVSSYVRSDLPSLWTSRAPARIATIRCPEARAPRVHRRDGGPL